MYTTNNSFTNLYLNLEGLSDLFPSFLPEGLFDIFLHICQKETIHLEISLVCLFSYLILSSGDSVSTEMWPGSVWRWSFHWNCVQLTKTLWCCSIQGNSHLTVSMQKLEKQLLNFRYRGMRRFHPLPRYFNHVVPQRNHFKLQLVSYLTPSFDNNCMQFFFCFLPIKKPNTAINSSK